MWSARIIVASLSSYRLPAARVRMPRLAPARAHLLATARCPRASHTHVCADRSRAQCDGPLTWRRTSLALPSCSCRTALGHAEKPLCCASGRPALRPLSLLLSLQPWQFRASPPMPAHLLARADRSRGTVGVPHGYRAAWGCSCTPKYAVEELAPGRLIEHGR